MILDSKETTVAYRCPKCGKIIKSLVGIFALTGDLIKLKCDCGGSELSLVKTNDGKVRITTPCIVCASPHNFVLSTNTFFSSDVFRYSCPYSGIDLCFIGDEKKVGEAANEADEALLKLLNEAGVTDFQTFAEAKEADDEANSGEYADPQMQSIVHFMLCELEDEGNISCRCPSHGKYEFKFVGKNLDSVLIYCTECSASVSIPLPDAIAANAFLHIDKLRLT
jgi:hypothetical protein